MALPGGISPGPSLWADKKKSTCFSKEAGAYFCLRRRAHHTQTREEGALNGNRSSRGARRRGGPERGSGGGASFRRGNRCQKEENPAAAQALRGPETNVRKRPKKEEGPDRGGRRRPTVHPGSPGPSGQGSKEVSFLLFFRRVRNQGLLFLSDAVIIVMSNRFIF